PTPKSRIAAVLPPAFATAKSVFPSPLRSPIATDSGHGFTWTLVADPKAPVPVLRRIETDSSPSFDTARSGFPSPLRSPITTECGRDPTAKFVAGLKDTV